MLLCWDRGRHHFEIEFEECGFPYCFYRNRRTGETWGRNFYLDEEPMPADVEAVLMEHWGMRPKDDDATPE